MPWEYDPALQGRHARSLWESLPFTWKPGPQSDRVGDSVGRAEGASVGKEDGAGVSVTVGMGVGVGSFVGLGVGLGVGARVGFARVGREVDPGVVGCGGCGVGGSVGVPGM